MSESLRIYLCETDRCVTDKALCVAALDEDDKDDFLDLLSRVNCHSIPKHDAVQQYVLRTAHKELTQEPEYAIDSIASTPREGLQLLLPCPDGIRDMFDGKKPTPRKVIKLLDANPLDNEQGSALSYLKRFIRRLDDTILKKFLRHVAELELPSTYTSYPELELPSTYTSYPELELPSTYTSYPELELPSTYTSYPELELPSTYTSYPELELPSTYTSYPELELPSTYTSYPELRSKFMFILDGNYLNMDTV
ncbi:hypothetical protein LSAT2_004164, partial [Lamellibrachia satsuma]